ncbi:MAG: prolyl oligopeptidase family serine peptidase, partial [Lachnospiraceae bacterium]
TKNSEISQMILVDDFEHGLEYRTNTIEILKDQLENDVLYYASYKPKNQENNPLLIWLHGGGEGGTDTRIPLLGNKATVFAGDDFQNIMGGSYVLVPQCPTVWRNATGEGNDLTGENPTSIYTEILMELIENYVQENSTIDRKRIYIGGCSNGGYMTMNMLINYPEYFAAAFPICEAYLDEYISNEEIKKLAKIPIWFTHSVDDTVIDPEKNTISTYKRLLETGAKNTYLSLWKNVYDTSGKFKDNNGNPIVYFGHESWRYVFNNECTVDNDYEFNTSIEQVGNGKTIFEWLSEQQNN